MEKIVTPAILSNWFMTFSVSWKTKWDFLQVQLKIIIPLRQKRCMFLPSGWVHWDLYC